MTSSPTPTTAWNARAADPLDGAALRTPTMTTPARQ
jgi:hypothetical protein